MTMMPQGPDAPYQPISPAPVSYAPVPAYHYGMQGPAFYGIAPPRPSSSAAVLALVMGAVGVFIGWCTLGIPCLIAVVAGHAGLSETKDGGRSGRGMAVAGLVLGYVMVAPAVVLTFWLVLGMIGGTA